MSGPARDLPPLEWIRVFETAARHMNFTAAAAELGLTQAAVSQRIRNLERRVGAQLFNRHPRGVTLTTQGEAWLPDVQIALAQLGRSAANLFAAPRRKIVLATSASVIGLWIIPRLRRIAEQLPHLQIVCETINTLTDYGRIEADFEIRFGAGNWPGRVSRRLYPEDLTPLVAPGLLADGRPWRDLPLIATSGPRLGWRDWFDAEGEPPGPMPMMRFDTFIQSWQAALCGAGVMLGSVSLCAAEIAKGQLVRPSPKNLSMQTAYWITWRVDAHPFREREVLIEILADPDCAPPEIRAV